MPDIEKMTSNEWINYRYDLVDKHLAKGKKLEPSIDCSYCDVVNDYLCFFCECNQIDKEKP
jgi:hypothetical protein